MTPADSTPTPSGPPPGTSRRRLLQSVLSVLLVIVVVALTWWLDAGGTDDTATPATTSSATSPTGAGGPGPTAPVTEATDEAETGTVNPDIPAHVRRTLMLIDDGDWPAAAEAPGTRGGDTFRNAERRLPRTTDDGTAIRYREWDVNPKQPGRNRDAERIVTGDDGSAWYTDDHYQSFVPIRGPDL